MDSFALLNEIQTIARNGLHYSDNPYDRERYGRLLEIASSGYSDLLEMPGDDLKAAFRAEIGQITPKIGADAAIFNEKGEILLMDRIDGSGWCLPCGWMEPNERACETAVREVREETGLEVEVARFVGAFTRFPSAGNGAHTMVALVHLCKIIGGKLTLSHEGKALRYWNIDEMNNWHATHEKYARAAYEMWRGDGTVTAVSD